MPQEGSFVATVFAPIMFPPAPVLVFTQDKHTSKCLNSPEFGGALFGGLQLRACGKFSCQVLQYCWVTTEKTN